MIGAGANKTLKQENERLNKTLTRIESDFKSFKQTATSVELENRELNERIVRYQGSVEYLEKQIKFKDNRIDVLIKRNFWQRVWRHFEK